MAWGHLMHGLDNAETALTRYAAEKVAAGYRPGDLVTSYQAMDDVVTWYTDQGMNPDDDAVDAVVEEVRTALLAGGAYTLAI